LTKPVKPVLIALSSRCDILTKFIGNAALAKAEMI
jgi:hypothetical protein